MLEKIPNVAIDYKLPCTLCHRMIYKSKTKKARYYFKPNRVSFCCKCFTKLRQLRVIKDG